MQSTDEGASLYLDLSSLESGGSRFSLTETASGFYGLSAPPASSTAFPCYAVNVTGPGISDSSPHSSGDIAFKFDRALRGESSCIYRGVVTPPIQLNATGPTSVALQIPPGGVRLVQIAGVNDPLVCESGVINDPPGSTSGGRYFEIGRAVLTDVFGDRSVDVTTNWPSGITAADQALRDARAMDCGDGICGNISTLAQASDATALALTTNTEIYAFKLTNVPGKSIRRVTLLLLPESTVAGSLSVNAKVTLCVKSVGDAMANLTCSPIYTQTKTLAHAASAGVYTFDLVDPATQTAMKMIDSNHEYWVELTAPDATTGTFYKRLSLIHNPSGSTTNDFQYSPTGTSWSAQLSNGVVHEAFGCGV